MTPTRTPPPPPTPPSSATTPSSSSPRLPSGRRAPLRRRLVVLLVVTVGIVCLVLGLVTHASLRTQLDAELDAQLLRAADRAVGREQLEEDGPSVPSPPPGGPAQNAGDSGEFELTARREDGDLVSAVWRDQDGTTRELSHEDVDLLAQAIERAEAGDRITADLSIGAYRVVALPLGEGAPDGDQGGDQDGDEVVTGLPVSALRSTLLRLDLTLLGAGAAALAVTALAGSFIVRRTLRPLDDVAALASEVARTALDRGSVRLDDRVRPEHTVPGTEVGEVGRALNHLLDNVETAIATRQLSEERMRRFIADASHELRTPLTAIRGYTEMLRLTEELGEHGTQSVERLEAQSRRMTSLVEDLLLLTRLDDGAPQAREEVDLGEVVMDSVMDARAAAPRHRHDVDVPDAPVLVQGDPRQLTQVVVNLLSNARKHTPEGTAVHVRLRREGTRARLSVIDDGPGIDPELVPDVFSRFARADRARSGREGTTGLGLSIVRAVVEAHDGDIGVDSRPGRTVFTVSLPLAAA
ncbi:sensor histidine kinase [Brachybacterium sp. AOP43-C2-M15]|uniref:sensor histidine kinase n=1 Tax=Brachybacterium sp. AOP43-C2-M15 TaxID=3457661 RepID=UPI00403465C6